MQFIQTLSGVQLNENATILSVTATDVNINANNTGTSLLITLLATEGGSEELTQELGALVNTTAKEIGLRVILLPVRFG